MTTTQPAGPVFGRRTNPEARTSFTLISYRRGEEVQHQFTASTEVDAATAMGAMSAGRPGKQASVMIRFLRRSLVDDDGLSVDVTPDPIVPEEFEGEDYDVRLHEGEWSLDGEAFPNLDAAEKYAAENGSSLRRFMALLDDDDHHIELTALGEIVKFVIKDGAGRPTKPSPPSSRRRTKARR